MPPQLLRGLKPTDKGDKNYKEDKPDDSGERENNQDGGACGDSRREGGRVGKKGDKNYKGDKPDERRERENTQDGGACGDSKKVGGGGVGKKGGVRRAVLLSCTHVFHETCLLTLEELAMGDVRNSCPVCRTPYQKRVIPFD
jgi:hypothetical protein